MEGCTEKENTDKIVIIIDKERNKKKSNLDLTVTDEECIYWLKMNCRCPECCDLLKSKLDIDILKRNILKKNLSMKLASYRQQDIKKNRYDTNKFISQRQCIIKVIHSNPSELSCRYCRDKIKLYYEHVRDPKQWTLDRLDNNIGHIEENVVICCLKCNLEKRRKNEENFIFQKQFQIEKFQQF